MTQVTRNPRLRALHAVPNAPAVDVHLDRTPLITNLGYSEYSDYAAIGAGDHTFAVFPTGRSDKALVSGDVNEVKAGMDYTMVVLGQPDKGVHAQIMHDSTAMPVGDVAKVRFLHASPDAPAVDIVAGGTTLFSNLSFRDITPYAEVPSGAVDLEVRAAGSNEAVLALPGFQLMAGNVYSFVALGLLKGSPALTVIPLTMAVAERMPA